MPHGATAGSRRKKHHIMFLVFLEFHPSFGHRSVLQTHTSGRESGKPKVPLWSDPSLSPLEGDVVVYKQAVAAVLFFFFFFLAADAVCTWLVAIGLDDGCLN